MKKLFYISIIFIGLWFCQSPNVIAQGVGINPSGNIADPSAMLDVSGVSKGVLINRMTSTERDAIVYPAEGLMIFNITTKCFNVYKNLGWYEWCGTCVPPATPIAGNNGPICEGSALFLTASSISNASYNWTGPNSFISTLQNPAVSANANIAMSGTYSVTAASPNGCSSTGTTIVVVNSTPAAPTAATNSPSQYQIVWNWHAVPGATGYKWNTINNYGSATDNSIDTTYSQTALACSTPYTLFVWAYSNCGNSVVATLAQTTSCCSSDGTGGAITHANGKTIHTFTSSGTFTPSCAGNVEVLVVAGGGGGGGGFGGGGGAGGVIYNPSYAVSTSPITVTIGDGGNGGINEGGYGTDGHNSVFGTLTAIGGGAGGGFDARIGGSGSGGGRDSGPRLGGTGFPGQGNDGGASIITNDYSHYDTGGGGGAGGVGGTGNDFVAGNGGLGIQYSISGSPLYYASGGGGASVGGTYGTASAGGGGNGCNVPNLSSPGCNGGSGTPNTGGGGGGSSGYNGSVGGNGGSGIVIISYPTP